MKSTLLRIGGFLAVGAMALCHSPAAELISNGGFESGLSAWSTADAVGGDGTFYLQSGTTSPSIAEPVPAPPGGVNAAMSDGQGPGSHVLYQDFLVLGVVGSALLTLDLFIGNRGQDFYTPDHLDFSLNELNQQARVDILKSGTDPFSVSPTDVLFTVYQTQSGDPLVSGYDPLSVDLTGLLNSYLNQTLRLRFAEVDNFGPLQMGVDNISLVTRETPGAVPDMATTSLLLSMVIVPLAVMRRGYFTK